MDLDLLVERVERCELLREAEVRWVCDTVKELLLEESNVQRISSPVTVVGDVHGQFYDLLELFRVAGSVPDVNFLFLGDFVDRGHHSVETISLLLCYKCRYPNRITLLRGNHESRAITKVYGFYDECMRKYGNSTVWSYFTDTFDYLTISAIVDDSVFAVHGGLSPDIRTLDQIRVIERFDEVPKDGPLSDLLWSDPDPNGQGFEVSSRGVGYVFGENIVKQFMHENRIRQIIRAHQLCMDGFQVLFGGAFATVWSAPNYCYRCGNVAAVLEIDESLNFHFNTFLEAPESDREAAAPTKEVPDYFL